MMSVLKNNGRMAVVMPHGVLFRGSEEKSMRKWMVEQGLLEAVIGLPPALFYGTGIPASILVINKNDAAKRKRVLFINADREYKDGKNQNKLRPEDISKISFVCHKKADIDGYSKNVSFAELEKEDFNFNIRRYVDNSPPPEPQDVHAHLHGGIPVKEVDSLGPYFTNYAGVKERLFKNLKKGYYSYISAISSKEDIKTITDTAEGIINKHKAYEQKIDNWWENSLEHLVNLPRNKNLFELNKEFSKSITEQFSKLGILDLNKSRGAFAAYWDTLSSDMKSVSASGWNAELIPEDDILKSQFPDVLEELKANEATSDEVEAMLKEVNDLEDDEYNEEDYEVYPKAMLKEYKDQLKEINGEIRAAKKEIKNLNMRIKVADDAKTLLAEKADFEKQLSEYQVAVDAIEQKLAVHMQHETKLKEAKKVIKEIKDRQEELVAKAREKITSDEAKELILARWKEVLHTTIMSYVADYQREFLRKLENLYEKYTVTINDILKEREKESSLLDGVLRELGYEDSE